MHVLNLLCKNMTFRQNKAEANGGGLRDPEALLREPGRGELAAEAGARAAAAVGGGRWALRPVVPGDGHGHGERLPVVRQGHRHERRRRDKRQDLHQLLLLICSVSMSS